MKAKTIVLTMALCFVAAAVCFADESFKDAGGRAI
jgi:hypothetical protein